MPVNFHRTTSSSRGRPWVLAAALAAAFAAPPLLAQTTGGAAPGTLSDSKAGARPASQLQRADEGMLKDIAQANMAEIETGQLALDKSKDDRVRKFAQMMVDDHGTALKEVQQLAQTKGVSLPDGPGAKHKTKAMAMKALSGDTFDKQYMSHAGVGDHRSTLELLQKTQRNAKDSDLKALAGKMIPVVQSHLNEAEQITPHKKG